MANSCCEHSQGSTENDKPIGLPVRWCETKPNYDPGDLWTPKLCRFIAFETTCSRPYRIIRKDNAWDTEVMSIAIVAALNHAASFVKAVEMRTEHGYIAMMLGRNRFNRR